MQSDSEASRNQGKRVGYSPPHLPVETDSSDLRSFLSPPGSGMFGMTRFVV
jgi:hypothetical protein